MEPVVTLDVIKSLVSERGAEPVPIGSLLA
jgi:hypothetical protein